KLRLVHNGGGNTKPLLHSEGIIGKDFSFLFMQPHNFKSFLYSTFRYSPSQFSESLQILIPCYITVKSRCFDNRAYFAIKGMDIFLIVCAKQAYRSIRSESKLQHHFHCCGFACSVSAEQTINFARWHMKIDLIDNGGCSVSLRKIFCFNDIINI